MAIDDIRSDFELLDTWEDRFRYVMELGRALPPLVDLERADPFAADLALRLNRLGQPAQGPILASLYRHLAHWPAYLGLSLVQLAPLAADGRLAAAIET